MNASVRNAVIWLLVCSTVPLSASASNKEHPISCRALIGTMTTALATRARATSNPDDLLQNAVFSRNNVNVHRYAMVLTKQASEGSVSERLEAKKSLVLAFSGAAMIDNEKAMQSLLLVNPKLFRNMPAGSSPATYAARCGQLGALRFMKKHGVSLYTSGKMTRQINVPNDALETAVYGGWFKTAMWLLHNGYDMCQGESPERMLRLKHFAKSKRSATPTALNGAIIGAKCPASK